MLARTKQLTNLIVLISTIPKLHCTKTTILLGFYCLFPDKKTDKAFIQNASICHARQITSLDIYMVKYIILDIYKLHV